MMSKITALRPVWNHNSDGKIIGVSFTCPLCTPGAACRIKMEWDRASKKGENFTNMGYLTIHKPFTIEASKPECEFPNKFTIKDGVIVY